MLAITAAAYVDYALEMVIRERFRIDKDEDARIFDGAQNGFFIHGVVKNHSRLCGPFSRKAVARRPAYYQ